MNNLIEIHESDLLDIPASVLVVIKSSLLSRGMTLRAICGAAQIPGPTWDAWLLGTEKPTRRHWRALVNALPDETYTLALAAYMRAMQ